MSSEETLQRRRAMPRPKPMPKRKTLQPTNANKAKRQKLLIAIAQATEAIEQQEQAIERLWETIKRWTKTARALEETLGIAKRYRQTLKLEAEKLDP